MDDHTAELSITRRGAITAGVGAFTASQLFGQSATPPKLGVIGLGNRAQRHLAAYEEMGDVEVAALCDIQGDRARAAKKGAAAGATVYVDYRELIADRNVQAVVIAVPNYLHAEVAIAAMKAGKDVLLEKPIGLTYEEALTVADAAKRYGRILAVGMQRYYADDYRTIIEFVRSGGLGKVDLFALNEYRGDWNPKTWAPTDPETGKKIPWRHLRKLAGSSLLEYSVHSYGFLYEMIDSRLTRCSATGGPVHWPERTTEDVMAVIVDYASGARLQHTYCGFARGAAWQLTIAGERGSLQFDRRSAMVRREGEEPFELEVSRTKTSNEAQLYREFFRNVRERSQSPLNPEFAIEASKVAYAAWLSIDEQRIVTDEDFA